MVLTYLTLLVLVGASLPAVVRSFLPPLPRRITGITPQAVVVLGAGRRQRNGRFSLTTRGPAPYTHLRAHGTVLDLVCRLLPAKKNTLHTSTPSAA